MKHPVTIYCRRFEPCSVKQQHRYGRELLCQALREEYNIDFTEEMMMLAANGKPGLKELPIFFNISHCSGMAALALSDVPVGVDVETTRSVTDSLIRRTLSPWEQEYVVGQDRIARFLELWTLKESFIKMTGEGLRTSMNTVQFQFMDKEDMDKENVDMVDMGSEEFGKEQIRVVSDPLSSVELWRTSARIRCNRSGQFCQWKIDGTYILSLCWLVAGAR